MKAIMYEKSGSSALLVAREAKKPMPKGDEALVRIHAASLNAADYRSMRMGIIPKSRIFGADIAGVVEAVGPECGRWKVGDEVFGDTSGCGFGGFAEYAAVPEGVLARKPAGPTFAEAAAVPMAATTALQALRDKGAIRAGQKVLICGAGGGVGTYAVQLAKRFGGETTAVCGTANAELVRSLGADRVIDYTKEDLRILPGRYDLVVAVNGKLPLSVYRALLAPKGVLVTVGGGLSQVFASLLIGPFLSLGGQKFLTLAAKPSVPDLDFLIGLVAEGKLRPVIERRIPLSGVPDAMRYLEQGHARGKIVVDLAGEDAARS